jgi:tRNA (guanine37-N1)-methyltransferase
MLRFDIVTLFPEMFGAFCRTSMVGRAVENALIEVNTVYLREYGLGRHRHVDDYPYGGGAGMVMRPEPLSDALDVLLADQSERPFVVYFSPKGEPLTQDMAQGLYADHSHYILLCGHYEGMDQRVIETYVDREISIGDYVLTGGELPAMVLVDCMSRLVPGVLGSELSAEEESFEDGLLEYPQYTRPAQFKGMDVPEVLLSGDHARIAEWRERQRLRLTYARRPDLIREQNLSPRQRKWLAEIKENAGRSDRLPNP